MSRVFAFLAVGLSLALAASCNRADRDEARLESEPTVAGDRNPVPPSPITVEGCLTAAGDRFVLTQLKAEAAAPETAPSDSTRPGADQPSTALPTPTARGSADPGTEAYRLVGMEDQLRPLVGKRVRITGEAEPEQVVDLRQSSPPSSPSQPAGTNRPAGTSGPEAQVGTTESARIEINDLQVGSVSATSEPCTATR